MKAIDKAKSFLKKYRHCLGTVILPDLYAMVCFTWSGVQMYGIT